MANNAEHLEAIFLKDHLAKTDVVDLLSGHRVRFAKGSGGSSVYNLVTGKKVDGSKAKDIIERWRSLKEIWESSTHGRSEIGLTFDPTADDMMIPRNYVLRWVRTKQKGTNTLFDGFRECNRYALEQEWITTRDYAPIDEKPLEEAPLEEAPKKVKSELEPVPTQEELGETKEENLLRLIGILKNMLKDKKVIEQLKRNPETFVTQKDLNQYVSGLYGEDLPNKGLQPTQLNTIWGEANRILKKDEDPS